MASDSARNVAVGVTVEGRDSSAPALRALRRLGQAATSTNVSMRGLRDAARSVASVTGAVTGVAVGATAAVGLLARTAYRSIDAWATGADHLAKLSRQLRVNIGDLQAWAYVAEREGVEASVLEGSLQGLAKAIGMLALRKGRGYALLQSVVGGQDLIRRLQQAPDTLAALRVALDALRRVAPQYRAAIAAALGLDPQMLRLVEQSQASLDALIEQRRRYGVLTAQSAAAGEAWTDSLTALNAAVEGLKTKAFPGLIRAALPWIDRLTEWIAGNDRLGPQIEAVSRVILDTVAGAAMALRDVVGHLADIDRIIRTIRTGGGKAEVRRRGLLVESPAQAEAQAEIERLRALGLVSDQEVAAALALGRRDWSSQERATIAAMERLQRTASLRGAVTIQVAAAPGTTAEVSRVDGDALEVVPLGGIPALGGAR